MKEKKSKYDYDIDYIIHNFRFRNKGVDEIEEKND